MAIRALSSSSIWPDMKWLILTISNCNLIRIDTSRLYVFNDTTQKTNGCYDRPALRLWHGGCLLASNETQTSPFISVKHYRPKNLPEFKPLQCNYIG